MFVAIISVVVLLLFNIITAFTDTCEIIFTGHIAHEWTPWSSIESMFTFIKEKLPYDEINSAKTQPKKENFFKQKWNSLIHKNGKKTET